MDTPPTTLLPDQPLPNPAAAPDHPHLTSYLADHDAPCPHCRYNLRGVSGSTCPECGNSIELALSTLSRFGGRGLFLLAALLVVLIGGSIAATRQWREVHAAATSGGMLFGGTPLRLTTTSTGMTVVSANGRIITTPNSTGTVTLNAPTITLNGAGSATATTPSPSSPARTPRATVNRLTTAASPVSTFTTFAPMAATPATWSAVTLGQWSMLGLWSILALAALAALLLLLILRARKNNPSARWLRTLSAASISLLALFGAAHITLFIADLLR